MIDPDFPAESERYDVTRRFRIEAGESIGYADTLDAARLVAGEWQAADLDERIVTITGQAGRPRRWRAKLLPSGAVRLVELFADPDPEDAGARRLAVLAGYIDRERAREKARRGPDPAPDPRRVKCGKGHRRGLVCYCEPPRAFGSVRAAADWAGVRSPSLSAALKRGRRCGGFCWDYADRLLRQPAAPAAAIVATAREALRLAGRRAPAETKERGNAFQESEQQAGAGEPPARDGV